MSFTELPVNSLHEFLPLELGQASIRDFYESVHSFALVRFHNFSARFALDVTAADVLAIASL